MTILNYGLREFMKGSKAVDSQGNPIVAYHGTKADVAFFDRAMSNSSSKTGCPDGSFFFSSSPEVASSYTVSWQGDFSATLHEGANVMPVFLNIQRPLKVSAKGDNWRNIEYKGEWYSSNDLTQLAKDSGRYDGLIISRVMDKGIGHVDEPQSTIYVAFAPEQIKSALGDDHRFTPDSPFLISKSPSAQALDNYRYCLTARATKCWDDHLDYETVRKRELEVFIAPMNFEQRIEFFTSEFTRHHGWFTTMASNHVLGVMSNGLADPERQLFDDLGADWTILGTQVLNGFFNGKDQAVEHESLSRLELNQERAEPRAAQYELDI